MISVIVTTLNDERRLGATLASLVPAAMNAVVREVIVADGGSADQTLEIAEDAGARVIGGADAFRQACEQARQPWLLILAAGARLEDSWEAAAVEHAAHDEPVQLRSSAKGGWLGFQARAGQAEGLLVLRAQCLGVKDGQGGSPAALVAALKPRRRDALRVLAPKRG